jgi:hypothetical protein
MKKILLVFCILYFGSNSWAQQTSKPEFSIPSNEYLASKMVSEHENERKQLSLDLKYVERILAVIQENSSVLNSYKHEKIDSKETLRNAYNKIKFKSFEREEFTNVSDFEIKDIALELYRTNFMGNLFYDIDYDETIKADYVKIDENFKKDIEKVKETFNSLKERAEKAKTLTSKKIEEIDNKLTDLYGYKSQNTDLHRISILVGLPAFCITILFLFLVPYFLEKKSTSNDSTENNKQYLLDVATVLLLTLTILILGLAKMITGEVLGTLLGGISGYVLNRTSNRSTN